MKMRRIFRLTSFIALGGAIASCSSVEDLKQSYPSVQVNTDPEVMEVHADTIDLTITGQVPEGYMDNDAVIKFNPYIQHEDGKKKLDRFFVKGSDVEIEQDVNTIATIDEGGGSFEKSIKFPYESSFKTATLEAKVDFQKKSNYDSLSKCCEEPISDTITRGTITTPLTVKPFDIVRMAGVERAEADKSRKPGERPGELEGGRSGVFSPEENRRSPGEGVIKPERVTHQGTIFFKINRANIRASEKEGEAMQRIRDFARQKQLKIRTVKINSYASPDGELERNATLTQNRGDNTFDYMKEELRALGHASVNDTNFQKQAETKEDWDGFRRLARKSDFPSKDKVLDIATSSMALEEKEDALRELEVFDGYLAETLLPKLRRSEIEIIGFKRIRPLDTLRAISERDGLDSLHRKELLKLGYRSNDIDQKREVYKHYSERFPDDFIGPNNLNALLLYEGRYDEALKAFKQLNEQFPNKGPILNNLGVAYRHANEYAMAREKYEAARSEGIDERNNLGILDINVAEYASATESFENNRYDYNVALAHTLNDSYEEALDVISSITTKTADVYYLKAIVGARMGDEEIMTTSLRRAVEKGGQEAGIRDRAKQDLEFREYHGSEEFKNAIRY